MRVTHVITRLVVGGAQENTVASVLGLRNKPDVEVSLIAGPTVGPEGSVEHLVSAERGLLTVIPELVRPIHPWRDWVTLRKLTRLFCERRPDIVHTHSGKAGFLGRLAARRAGVPVIIHTIHGPSFGAFQGGLANVVFRTAERFAGKRTTHFISVADAMTRQYLAAGIGRPEQYTLIFSGFVLEPFLEARNDSGLRQRLGLALDDFVVGKIGRLFKLKGHDDLFAAASRMVEKSPRIKFLLVGDGPWRQRFEARAGAPGLKGRFVFAGLIPPDEVPKYVGIMDALVHLSMREGLPRAVPQALAAGKPVVAYNSDGTREICLDGETGFLVEPGDLPGLINRVLQLEQDADLRERLGRRGRERVRARFSLPMMIDQIYALYLKLLLQSPTGISR